MSKIFIVSYYTLQDLIKSKILLNIVILGFVLSIITYVAYSFTFAVPEKVTLDIGLALLSLSAVMIAVFMGVGLLSYEIENRTLYMVLSRPISRTGFLLGKILGMAFFILIDLIIMSSIVLLLYFLLGGIFQILILNVISFIFIESIIMLSIVVFFSLFLNRPITVLLSLSIYILGFAVGAARETIFAKENPLIIWGLDVYSYLFPIFSKLNYKDFLLYNVDIESSQLLYSYLYGISYFLVISFATSYIFRKINLD